MKLYTIKQFKWNYCEITEGWHSNPAVCDIYKDKDNPNKWELRMEIPNLLYRAFGSDLEELKKSAQIHYNIKALEYLEVYNG